MHSLELPEIRFKRIDYKDLQDGQIYMYDTKISPLDIIRCGILWGFDEGKRFIHDWKITFALPYEHSNDNRLTHIDEMKVWIVKNP